MDSGSKNSAFGHSSQEGHSESDHVNENSGDAALSDSNFVESNDRSSAVDLPTAPKNSWNDVSYGNEGQTCHVSYPLPLWETRGLQQPCGLDVEECPSCRDTPYRELSGICNNDDELGVSGTPFLRILKARYEDGVSKMIKSKAHGKLPSPRLLSATLFKDRKRPDKTNSLLLMQWGQVVAHDTGFHVEKTKEDGSPFDCCPQGSHYNGEGRGGRWDENCLPISIPKDDYFYSIYSQRCMNFVRSVWIKCPKMHGSKSSSSSSSSEESREKSGRHGDKSVQQINHVSSFLDVSILYGNDDILGSQLRVGRDGLLKARKLRSSTKGHYDSYYPDEESDERPKGKLVRKRVLGATYCACIQVTALQIFGLFRSLEESPSPSESGGYPRLEWEEDSHYDRQEFLPLLWEEAQSCPGHPSSSKSAYLTGDERVDIHPWLASNHVLLLREHNRLARELRRMHRDWDDERLYQEARRIVIAQVQLITYREYLPKIVGQGILEKMDMLMDSKWAKKGGTYNAQVNPSTMLVFTSAAFRYLHTLITGNIETQSEGRCPLQNFGFSDLILHANIMEKSKFLTSIFRGLTNQPSGGADMFVTEEITNKLMKSGQPYGVDLTSIDIQRGRDHGVPSYNDMRKMCGLPKAKEFKDFADVMSHKKIQQLKNLYDSVNDVDLLVGGYMEDSCWGAYSSGIVGHTFGCIISEQFYRWWKGDRYFFDNVNGPGKFTNGQFKALLKVSLSSLLCENLHGLKYMQEDAFSIVSDDNPLRRCGDIPRLDLDPWVDYHPKKNCTKKMNKHKYKKNKYSDEVDLQE
ncbi:salivary peroxidase/catechol oxidase-like [Hetaerina americana]|uniref:salivary peroxidase/catechol oxidase-like n=1 Tax=Hetaerina americana TaxID=62018 RepID=UPI003A7F361A